MGDDLNLFSGGSVEDLQVFLEKGGMECKGWTEQTYKDLIEHVRIGKCELGKNKEGKPMRVTSTAKVFVYDEDFDLLLVNPLNSFEKPDVVQENQKNFKRFIDPLANALGKGKKPKGNFKSSRKVEPKSVEIPGQLVFETNFSPFKENPTEAGARVVAWRLGLESMSPKSFHKHIPKVVRHSVSTHYPGLLSEYHVHHLKLSGSLIKPFQKVLKTNVVTPVSNNELTNSGTNTHWYVWLTKAQGGEAMVAQLQQMYDLVPKLKKMVGEVDFQGTVAQALGKQLEKETELIDMWKNK